LYGIKIEEAQVLLEMLLHQISEEETTISEVKIFKVTILEDKISTIVEEVKITEDNSSTTMLSYMKIKIKEKRRQVECSYLWPPPRIMNMILG